MTVSDCVSILTDNKKIKVLFFIIFIFPKVILFSFAEVINKKLITDKFFLPQNLMFYRGCFELLVLLIIIIPILYFTSKLNLDTIQTLYQL